MSEIKALCQHRWRDIFKTFGLADSFLTKNNGPCPMCGGNDRYRMTDFQGYGYVICSQCMPPEQNVDGFEFLMRFTGKDFATIANEIKEILGETQARPAHNVDIDKQRQKLKAIWTQAKPLSKGDPVHRYLLGRGLEGLRFSQLTGLRYHPAMTYWHMEGEELMDLGKHPVMIGLVVTPEGLPSTIHCTYLGVNPDGSVVKGAFDPPRKMMTPSRSINGGAIRLQPLAEGQTLIVAEGIETALAMKLRYPDCAAWAVISAGNMEKFTPPNDFSSAVYIAADNDANHVGQAAAFQLAKKLSAKKIKASVLIPRKTGTDFLDQHNEQRQLSA